MKYPAATITRASSEILHAYRAMRTPSGDLTLSKIRVSADPKKWGFDFTPTAGPRYQGKRYGITHLDIAACVSPEWIHDTARMAESARAAIRLVAGTQTLETPANMDSLVLHHAWILNGNRLVLKPVKFLIFQCGSIKWESKSIHATRFSLLRDMSLNTAVFRKIIAKRMANLLLRNI